MRTRRLVQRLLGPGYYDEVAIAHRLLPQPGFMVDVGAHHGYAHRPFAEGGWKVLAIEPDPANRATLESTLHQNVTVDPRAIADPDGARVTLYASEVSSGISSLAAFHESHHAAATVETVRLDTLLATHGSPTVDFLKVDTEGFDLPVLQTFPWAEQRPPVVVCEFEDRKTVPLGYTYADLADFLVDKGYVVLMSEWYPIVEYGQDHAWRRVARYPASTSEPDGWGNFIAVEPRRARKAMLVARSAGLRLRLRKALRR